MDYISEIKRLKKEQNAVLLAHFYQPPEIQQLADFVGDSLELAKKAKNAECDEIVFCGVYFMAESAKILSPHKKVLIPEKSAGCPMADMITPADIEALRAAHPKAAVVIYVNSSAACKAHSDICCTSTNALKVVKSLPNDEIIFVPDKNLGSFVAAACPEKKFYYFDGCCPVHDTLRESDALAAKAAHPGAPMAAHPECRGELLKHADFVGSTAQIIAFCEKSPSREIIVSTEKGIIHKLSQACPDKVFYPVTDTLVCPDMKKISIQSLYRCMAEGSYEVKLGKDVIAAAGGCLDAMLAI